MSEKLVRKVVKAALEGKQKLDDPNVSYKDSCLAVMEAEERGLLKAADASDFDSSHPEYLIIGPTGLSQHYLREQTLWRRFLRSTWAIVVAVSGLVGLIDLILRLAKRH